MRHAFLTCGLLKYDYWWFYSIIYLLPKGYLALGTLSDAHVRLRVFLFMSLGNVHLFLLTVTWNPLYTDDSSTISETTLEVCLKEEFSAQCQFNEILLITKAVYGHIRQGRCAPKDFGHFGCFSDVTDFMESRCSLSRTCQVPLIDLVSAREIPDCAIGLVTYMEATYVCIKGMSATLSLCFPVAFPKYLNWKEDFSIIKYLFCLSHLITWLILSNGLSED